MQLRRAAAVASSVVLLAGCYTATIETGLAPSTTTIEQPFAASWIYGLVPPKTVSTMARCPKGVSKVMTQLSFVNSLVGGLTFGIFTPMTIKVTCAAGTTASVPAGSSSLAVRAEASAAVTQAVFASAAQAAATTGQPVFVTFAPAPPQQ